MSKKCSFNVHKDKGVFLNEKMFDKKDFVISCFFYLNI